MGLSVQKLHEPVRHTSGDKVQIPSCLDWLDTRYCCCFRSCQMTYVDGPYVFESVPGVLSLLIRHESLYVGIYDHAAVRVQCCCSVW